MLGHFDSSHARAATDRAPSRRREPFSRLALRAVLRVFNYLISSAGAVFPKTFGASSICLVLAPVLDEDPSAHLRYFGFPQSLSKGAAVYDTTYFSLRL